MATSVNGKAGETIVTDSGESTVRLDRNGNVTVAPAHGTFAEASRRGRLFVATSATPQTGVLAAAAHLSPVAAAAATLLSVYNPTNSGVELSIIQVSGDFISATVEVGTYTWNFHGYANVSAAMSAATIRNCRIGGASSPDGSHAKAYSGEAITGGVLGLQGPPIGMWAVAGTQRFMQTIDGLITVPQGGMVTIAAPTNGTATLSTWSIWFEEMPIITS